MPCRFDATWESLRTYRVPDWFMDAKLGIFIHWGIYAVPAFGNEWYPRNMYLRERPEFEHHLQRWGAQSQFGYKDFIPMFRAEKWDPAAWVELFAQAGARYVVPVAEHHDGFPMYATQRTRWNAANMGPRRDVVQQLGQAVRSAWLRFGVSTHRAFNWRYYTFADDFDTMDPAHAGLYGPAHPEDVPASDEFLADWFSRTKELVDKFEPDVLWFDFGWHRDEFEPYRPKVAAYYYNRALEWGKGVVLQYKDKFPDGTAVYDVERGKLGEIRPYYWQTDTSVSYKSWGFVQNDELKTVTTIVHDLVDIVSKNGNLLLNIGPRPDGTIPEEVAQILTGLGAWLQVNGEAIYGSRHWRAFGEGKANVVLGHLTERQNDPLTVKDLRFTAKGNVLYAILPQWPGAEVAIESLALRSCLLPEKIESVGMLGTDCSLTWRRTDEALIVELPTAPPCAHACTLKIILGQTC